MSEQNQQNEMQVESKWQLDVIEKLAFSALNEQKTARRWGFFFKGLAFAYVLILILMVS